jgi:hypothetical protein
VEGRPWRVGRTAPQPRGVALARWRLLRARWRRRRWRDARRRRLSLAAALA